MSLILMKFWAQFPHAHTLQGFVPSPAKLSGRELAAQALFMHDTGSW